MTNEEVFDEKLWKLKDSKVKFYVDPQKKPVFYKRREVLHAL